MDAVQREYAAAKAAYAKALARLKLAKAALPPRPDGRHENAVARREAESQADAARFKAKMARERNILDRFDAGLTKKAVAVWCGTTPAVVRRIVNHRTWIEFFDAEGNWIPHKFDEDGNRRNQEP